MGKNFVFVLRDKQLKGRPRVPHAPRGIDARRNRKREILGGNGVVSLSHQRGKTASGAGIEHLQPLRHDVAVFTEQGNAVRHRGERGKIEQLVRAVADERARKLKRHARAAEIVVGILVLQLGIDDDTVGQGFGQLVVIGDDDVRAQLVDILRLLRAGNTAVHRNKQLRLAILENPIDGLLGKPVAVRALGHVDVRFDAEFLQRVIHNRAGAYAVRVVIPKHRHRPALVPRRGDQRHRLLHALH